VCLSRLLLLILTWYSFSSSYIGLVFASSKRKVSTEQAKEIISAVRSKFPPGSTDHKSSLRGDAALKASGALQDRAVSLRNVAASTRPLFVGVFADQLREEVDQIAQDVDLDFIQLSGHEGFDSTESYVRPVLKAVHVASGQSAADVISAVPSSAAVGERYEIPSDLFFAPR
jgi:phosphoribosylanthranilate isomerase